MSLRVTPHRQFELGLGYSQASFGKAAQLQQNISSGIRVHRPSDDPQAQRVILAQQALINQLTSQSEIVDEAKLALNNAQTQTLDANNLLVKAKSLALSAQQADGDETRVIADQVDSVLNQLISIANAKAGGKFLFSGTSTGTSPFVAGDSVQYVGGNGVGTVSLPGQPPIDVYASGQAIFQRPSSGQLVVSGSTGAKAGSGTSSGAAPTTLTVTHALTTFAGGSGIQAGSSSATGDTIIGDTGTHTLTIVDTSGNGSAGTISLNGGAPILFTNADGDLQVTGPHGETVFVNTQSIAAGFNGTIDLTATGTISIDGGATQVPIDFSANQTLTDDAAGIVQHFDTSGITSTGADAVRPQTTGDLFQVLASLRDDLRNADLTAPELHERLTQAINDLDAGSEHILKIVGEQSVDLQQLETLGTRFSDFKVEANKVLTDTQGTDFTQAVLDLQEQQSLLQFSLTAVTQLADVSILDFL